MWKHPCAQVIFDSDPAPKGRSVPSQMEEMSQAMIRYLMLKTHTLSRSIVVMLYCPHSVKYLEKTIVKL